MKKLSVKNLLLLLIAYFCISCESQIESDVKEELSGEFKIEVIDAGFGNVDSKADTKTEEQGYKTYFSQGDEIGVFIINTSNNSIEYNNEKITFDGVSWSGDLRDKGSNMKFYAYYPYDEDININSVTGSNVESFFSSYVGSKQLVTDQSDYSDYTKADIMVGEGTVANNIVTFEMKHQMSLVVIKLPSEMKYITEYYLKSDNDYRWQRYKMKEITSLNNIYFSGSIPYAFNDGSYRFIVPATFSGNLSTGSFTANNEDKIYSVNLSGLKAGAYKEYNITVTSADIPEVEHTLAIGDIFKSDGGLISQAELKSPGITDDEKKECVGVVFQTYYKGDGTSKELTGRIGEAEINKLRDVTGNASYLPHGLVMASKDASKASMWKTTNTGDDVTTKNNVEQDAYDDFSGLKNCNDVKSSYGNYTSHPAFAAAASYSAKIPLDKTTGWFLPSMGQWVDIFDNLVGKTIIDAADKDNDPKYLASYWIKGISPQCSSKLDSYFSAIGNFDSFGWTSQQIQFFWSSSEYNASDAMTIFLNTDTNLCVNYNWGKMIPMRVRSILAF